MEFSHSASSIAGLTAFILIVLTSIPTFVRFFQGATSKARVSVPGEASKLYEDEDGIATEETQKEYTAALPKYLALSLSVLGFSISIGTAVYTTVSPTLILYFEHWLSVATWVRMSSKPVAYI